MRILFISPFLPYPENSGSKMRAMSIIRSLKSHKVFLLAFREEAEKYHDNELTKFCEELYVIQRPEITSFQRFINHFSLKPLLSKRFYLSESRKKIKHIIRDKEIDIVVGETLLVAEYIKNLKNIYKVLDEHNLEFVRASRRIEDCESWVKKIYLYLITIRLKRYELKIIQKFDRCLVCSEVDQKTIERFLPNSNVTVIPNSVDTQYFKLVKVKNESKKVTFTGTMWYEPNVDAVKYFIRKILPLLKNDLPNIEFTIVGDNPTEDILSLSQEKGVSITGHVKDIRPYLADSLVFVAPIRMGSGTRLKILSAMSMGIPIVSSKVGCEGIDTKDGESICIADTPYQFSNKIIKLFKEKDYRDRIAMAGRKLIETKYSLDVIGKKMDLLWKKIELTIVKDI